VGILENPSAARGLHSLPTSVDWIHIPDGSQVQQGAHHQVHVVPNLSHLPHDPPEHRGHNAHLPSAPIEFGALLVRGGSSHLAEWIAPFRADESVR